MKPMAILSLLLLARHKSAATLELTVKNAYEGLPTVTNSEADRRSGVPIRHSSIAFFSG